MDGHGEAAEELGIVAAIAMESAVVETDSVLPQRTGRSIKRRGEKPLGCHVSAFRIRQIGEER
jgi:hypothetical protein